MTRRVGSVAAAVLLVLAVLPIVIGVVYATQGAKSLPSFLPGHAHHGKYKETHKAIAAFVVGVVLLAAAGASAAFSRRSAV